MASISQSFKIKKQNGIKTSNTLKGHLSMKDYVAMLLIYYFDANYIEFNVKLYRVRKEYSDWRKFWRYCWD